MIDNPQNVFESLQNDVATILMATPPFNSIKMPDGSPFRVLTEDEGDIQFEYDALIAQCGLAIIVYAPTGKVISPDLPGPLSTLAQDVKVSEAVTFNRDTAVGTGIRAMRAAKVIAETLHLFVPPTTEINVPMQYTGFDVERQRTYISDKDRPGDGVLVVSRICHFTVALVQA